MLVAKKKCKEVMKDGVSRNVPAGSPFLNIDTLKVRNIHLWSREVLDSSEEGKKAFASIPESDYKYIDKEMFPSFDIKEVDTITEVKCAKCSEIFGNGDLAVSVEGDIICMECAKETALLNDGSEEPVTIENYEGELLSFNDGEFSSIGSAKEFFEDKKEGVDDAGTDGAGEGENTGDSEKDTIESGDSEDKEAGDSTGTDKGSDESTGNTTESGDKCPYTEEELNAMEIETLQGILKENNVRFGNNSKFPTLVKKILDEVR